jgi:molybdopterin-binding protein
VRIARSEIKRVIGTAKAKRSSGRKPVGLDAISGRNKLPGTVTELRFEGLLVQVTIDVGGHEITSIITSDAARSLGYESPPLIFVNSNKLLRLQSLRFFRRFICFYTNLYALQIALSKLRLQYGHTKLGKKTL